MCKDGFRNLYRNRVVETAEQIGRFGCFFLEFFRIPSLCLGFFFYNGEYVYLVLSSLLVLCYLLGWLIFRKEDSLRKSVLLSVLPSLLFLESGILTRNFPLIAAALLFAPCHITISVKNALAKESSPEKK